MTWFSPNRVRMVRNDNMSRRRIVIMQWISDFECRISAVSGADAADISEVRNPTSEIRLMEPVTLLARRPAVDFHYLKTLRHNRRIHECHCPRNRRHQLGRHFGRVHDLRSAAGFQTED